MGIWLIRVYISSLLKFSKSFQIKPSPGGEYELTDAVNLPRERKKVKVKEIQDYWLDFGNPADIIKLSQFLKTSKNFRS